MTIQDQINTLKAKNKKISEEKKEIMEKTNHLVDQVNCYLQENNQLDKNLDEARKKVRELEYRIEHMKIQLSQKDSAIKYHQDKGIETEKVLLAKIQTAEKFFSILAGAK